jgi:hypothetical protein
MSKRRSPARQVPPNAPPPQPLNQSTLPATIPKLQPPQLPPPKQTQFPEPPPKASPHPARHSRKCVICQHPDREALESDFVHWTSPEQIVRDYNLWDRQVLYRHARATGLHEIRHQNLRLTLEPILESAAYVRVTASDIIEAARAYSRIDKTGRWKEPAHEVVVSKGPVIDHDIQLVISEPLFRARQAQAASIAKREAEKAKEAEAKDPNLQFLIDTIPKLESHATPTKQRTATKSNRYKFAKTKIRASKRKDKIRSQNKLKKSATRYALQRSRHNSRRRMS